MICMNISCFFFLVVFVFQLVQITPMAGIVEKHVDIVHRMLHVTTEVVYVQMTVTAAIGPHCARSVSTLCILKQFWKIDILNFRMYSILSSVIWFSRVIRKQINGNLVNKRIPHEGIFLSCKCHILVTSKWRKWTKQRVIKNCAAKYKTSYRSPTVRPKLPLHCYV